MLLVVTGLVQQFMSWEGEEELLGHSREIKAMKCDHC